MKRSFLKDIFEDGFNPKKFIRDLIYENPTAFLPEEILSPELELTPILRRENREIKRNYWETPWGRLMLNPGVSNPRSKVAKEFRRKFRVPFPLFRDVLVRECEDANIFEIKDPIRVRVPTEFKILAALRILGRGNCAQDIEEFSGIKESTCFSIF